MAKKPVDKLDQAEQLTVDKYPSFNLHDIRHVTKKDDPNYGKELLDPVPMQPPAHYQRPPSLIETVREQIRAHHRLAADAEMDTEEDADDFEMDDDANDPHSKYENDFEPSIKELKNNRARIERAIADFDAANPPAQPAAHFTDAPQGQSPSSAPGADPSPQRGVGVGSAPGETPRPPPARRLW